ncbi:hypothetical protein B0H10DRAFT_1990859 [Mycena sp. CBHHK59/15]|nr:hypothetical protein B0H10DRAFT_1990859 [Mycena sp. CBHHK59/15]
MILLAALSNDLLQLSMILLAVLAVVVRLTHYTLVFLRRRSWYSMFVSSSEKGGGGRGRNAHPLATTCCRSQ